MSNKPTVGNFTRGAQLWSHQLRMFGQGLKNSTNVGIGSAISLFFYEVYSKLNHFEVYYWAVSKWASIKMRCLGILIKQEQVTIYFYNHFLQKWSSYKAYQFVQWKPIKFSVYRVGNFIDWVWSFECILEIIMAFIAGLTISALIFTYKGNQKHKRNIERGGTLINSTQLANLLKSKNEASDFVIEGLPFVKNSENTHTLLVGTTGAGKTNCLYKLLPQIRAKGQKAIIVDLNGNFISRYYRKDQDFLLNPFDARCTPWSPWADCLEESHYDAFAKAIIPGDNSVSDKFWDNSGATVLASTLRKLKAEGLILNSKLCYLLLNSRIKELENFLADTEAASIISEGGEKMTASVRASLNTQIKSLKYMEDTINPFSIREWIATTDDSWLFITASPDQRETLNPLISTWIDIALNGLMSTNKDDDRRIWFILDELPALQKIPSLKTMLAEARAYGGCVVAGIQNSSQLQSIYGYSESQVIMNLFNTLFIFRTQDPDTCKYLSNLLGEQEIREEQENMSYGAHQMRDGVNIQNIRRRALLVIPTEISLLSNLEAYVKLSGNWPITKLNMEYNNPPKVNIEFEKRIAKPLKTTLPISLASSKKSSKESKKDKKIKPMQDSSQMRGI